MTTSDIIFLLRCWSCSFSDHAPDAVQARQKAAAHLHEPDYSDHRVDIQEARAVKRVVQQ